MASTERVVSKKVPRVMRILHLIDSGGLYGAEKMLLTLVEEQIKHGLKPIILSVGDIGVGDKLLELEAEKLRLPLVKWRMKPGLNLAQTWAILNWANQEKIDILHSHGYKFNIPLGIIPRAARTQFFVTTVHGYVNAPKWSKMWLYEALDKFLLPRLDKVCVVSEEMNKFNAFSRLPPEKLAVVENGLSPVSSLHAQGIDLYGVLKHSFKILSVGRLSPEKNIASLIEALASNQLIDKNLVLFIVGEGKLRSELEQQTERLNLAHKVCFLGYREDVPALMRKANLLAMPSLTEGLPITLLEAMRCRLPVLASAVGGIPHALEHGKAGLLVTPGSDSSLVENLRKAVDGEVDLDKLAEHAHRLYKKCFTAEVMSKKYTAVYLSLVNRDSEGETVSKVEY